MANSLMRATILATLVAAAAGLTYAGPRAGAPPAPAAGAHANPTAAISGPIAPTTTAPTTPRSPAHVTGQPGQTCGSTSAPLTPGGAASAPGSAFNPDGKAGTVYAGEQPQNSRNTASVSQYDVACSHQPR